MQPADKGDDDGGEAVARRDRRQQLADRAGHFERARQARGGARDQQRAPQRAARREAGVARRRRRGAAHLQPIAREAAEHEHGHHRHQHQHHHEADMQARARHQVGQQVRGREHLRLREVHAVGILQRPVDHPQQQLLRDIGEHQRDQDLVGVEPVLEHRRERGPQHAADHAGQ
ncbi:hypothetical protein D9M72_469710 [compost metagenome]